MIRIRMENNFRSLSDIKSQKRKTSYSLLQISNRKKEETNVSQVVGLG